MGIGWIRPVAIIYCAAKKATFQKKKHRLYHQPIACL